MAEQVFKNESPCPYCGEIIPEGEWEQEYFDYYDQEAIWKRGVDLEYVFESAGDPHLYFVANCPSCQLEVLRRYKATSWEFDDFVC